MGKAVARVLLSPISAAVSLIDKRAGAALFSVISTAAAFIPGVGPLISAGLNLANAATGAYSLSGRRGGNLVPFDPKSVNPDKAAVRKLVFGRTAFPLDLRYAEPSSDTKQEYISYVFALAAHKSDAIESIYIEDKLAWTSGGGAQGIFVGYLTVEVILEAGAAAYHTVEAGANWASTRRMTGCTTMKVRVKRTDNSKTSQSPFASGISGRWTVIGRGMPVYDPARDSTVAGGSGSQRANDCTTWAYTASSVARGNNPALQLLAYLLGWKINGVGSVGLGVPPARLNLPSFAAAAAICDESVALAAGGSHRRYEAGKAYTDADDPSAVIAELLDAMNGELVHDGGKLALRLAVNDLTAEVALNEDDFLSGFEWQPQPELSEQFTVVRGRFTLPDAPSLFSLADYPDVSTGRTALAPRVLTLELPPVQDVRRAERIATQVARRSTKQGEFTVRLGIRGWLLRQNMVVSVTSASRGWTNKLFRVRGIQLATDASGAVDVRLREEEASIYSWSTSETGNIAPVNPVAYDNRLAASWLMAGIEAAATRNVARGNWATATAYDLGDIVNDGGNAYSCIVAHTSSGGNRPPSANWSLLVTGGGAGAAGDNVAIVTIWKRGATAPAGPTGSSVFDFNGTLTESTVGALNGWTLAIPAADGNPAWSRYAGARNGGTSDTITSGEWSAAVKALDNGADGESIKPIYKRSATQPSTPSPSTGVPSGWYGDTGSVPAGANPIWISLGTRPDSVANFTWQAATQLQAVSVAAFGQQVALGFSTSAVISVVLSPGQTASVEAQLTGNHTGTATTDINLEYRVEGGTWTAFGTSVPDSGGPGDITVATASGTFTNGGAGGVRYEVRATGTRTAANVTAVSAESYLRV